MGLTCSVLGHQYGERERTESRDEQGSEVIVTVQEVETCSRCGHEKVVTESKEVTAAHDQATADTPAEPTPEESVPVETPPVQTAPADEAAPEVADDGVDDGVIMSAEDEREHGEWPADDEPPADEDVDTETWTGVEEPEDDDPAEEPSSWPEQTGDDEGYDATVGDADDYDDDVIEATPDPRAATVDDASGGGFAKAGPIGSPNDPPAEDVHIEYYCPQCSWTAQSLTASVRAGDICPGCRAGYVAERDG